MDPWWLTHAGALSRGVLVASFLAFAIWETARPRHTLHLPTQRRWLLNGLFLVAASLASLVFRATGVALAVLVSASPYGLLNRPEIPFAVRAVLAFLLLDLVNYASHYLRHAVPLLWRFHKVHHADRDVDLSTGVRFHPGEVLFTTGCSLAAIAILAPPPSVVFCFEACNVVQAFFSHANIQLSPGVERKLRLVQVTRDLHEIHHSRRGFEQRSNLGVLFSIWDRLFGTYRAEPSSGAAPLPFGLDDVPDGDSTRAGKMLALPF